MLTPRARALTVLLALASGCAPTAAIPAPEPSSAAPVERVVVEAPDAALLGDAGALDDAAEPPPPVEVPAELDTALLDAPRLELAEAGSSDAGRLLVRGLPAMSADGRHVLVLSEQEEGPADLAIVDASTGTEARRWPYPQQWAQDGEELVPRTDARARRRVERLVRDGGYRALASVPLVAIDDDLDARPTLFAADDVRVAASTSIDDVDGSVLEITIDVGDVHLVVRDTEADHLAGVSIAPDRSFLVFDESFCACECAWWERVVPIPAS